MELKRATWWLLCALLFFRLARPQDFHLLAGHVIQTNYSGNSCDSGATSGDVIATFGDCFLKREGGQIVGSYALFLCTWPEFIKWHTATAEPTLEPTFLDLTPEPTPEPMYLPPSPPPSPNPSRPSRRPTPRPSLLPAVPFLVAPLSRELSAQQQTPPLDDLTFITVNFTYSSHDCSGDEASTIAHVYASEEDVPHFLHSGSCLSDPKKSGVVWYIKKFVQTRSFEFSYNVSGLLHSTGGEGLISGLPAIQMSALESLYNSTGGNRWKNNPTGKKWNFSKNARGEYFHDPCSELWHGIGCKQVGAKADIESIYISSSNLVGTIPSAISRLTQLELLSAYSNSLSGPIPAAIGDMTALTYLDLCLNSLLSTIPSAIVDNLTNLRVFSVWSNRLTGEIPSMEKLKKLSVLKLSDNFFSPGPLPDWISKLTNLQVLRLSDTSRTGPLRSDLVKLTNLVELSLATNQLTSTIPPFAGSSLGSLDLSNNRLDGVIPNLTAHAGLQNLQLSGNSLRNSIPTSLCKLSKIQVLDVSVNALLGSPPACLSRLSALRTLSLASNQLTNAGRGLDFLLAPNLQVVDASSNNFQGELPAEIFTRSRSMRIFAAAANCFQGALPAAAICEAKKLQVLVLDGLNAGASCRAPIFAGPANLFRFTGSVIRNKMSGSLPSCLFTSLPNITGLHLSGNELTGPGFTTEAWPSTLRNLVLSHNRLSYSIPLSLQKSMTQLELFDVSFNRIDGQLSSVRLSPNRSSFHAEVNRFSGLLSPSIIAAPRGSVSVLEGSLIDCSDRQAQLPVNDPYISHFKCGSLTFNVFLYTFAALVAFSLSLLAWQFRFSWGSALVWALPPSDVPVLDDSKASLIGRQLQSLELERRFCLSLMAVLVAVLLPIYGALSATQGTHTFLYAWAVSAAFKGGIASAATLLVLWSALLTFSDWHFSQTRRALIEVDSEQQQEEDSRLPSVSGLRNSKSSARAWLLLRLILIFSVNFAVIMPANIGYVFIVASYESGVQTTAAIMLTAFKQFWNKFVLSDALRNPTLFFGVSQDEIAVFRLEAMLGGFAFELFLAALNSVIIPALALLTADSNCFRTALYAPSQILSSYRFEVCKMTTTYTLGGSLTQDLTCDNSVHKSVSYQPAFNYGYQCSASLLQTYAPIFLLVALYSFAGEPVLHWCVRAALSRWPQLKSFHLLRLIPRIMHLPSERRIEEQGRKKARKTAAGHRFYRILDARAVYMSLLQDLMLLFTFGVVAPLLGLVLLSAIVLKSLRWHHLIVAFANSDEEKQGGGVEALLADLSDFSQTQHPFFKARWFILGYASLFLSFFLIDTAGDAEKRGWINAMWAPALMWVLPALLSLALQLFLPTSPGPQNVTVERAKANANEEAMWRGSLELQTLDTDTREGSFSDGRLSSSAPVSGRATVSAAQDLGWATANPLHSPRRSGNANPQQHLSLDTVKAPARLRSMDEPRNSANNTATL